MDKEGERENYEIAFWTKEEGDGAVKGLLAKHGATVEREKPVQKMRLAFPIKKESFAFLGTVIFSADADAVKNLVSDANLDGSILRFFLRRAKTPSADNGREGSREAATARERKSPLRLRDERKGAEQILTNEALEKKIEEISQ